MKSDVRYAIKAKMAHSKKGGFPEQMSISEWLLILDRTIEDAKFSYVTDKDHGEYRAL